MPCRSPFHPQVRPGGLNQRPESGSVPSGCGHQQPPGFRFERHGVFFDFFLSSSGSSRGRWAGASRNQAPTVPAAATTAANKGLFYEKTNMAYSNWNRWNTSNYAAYKCGYRRAYFMLSTCGVLLWLAWVSVMLIRIDLALNDLAERPVSSGRFSRESLRRTF